MAEETQPGESFSTESAQSQRLTSWKEIAAYLKRDVRTVQRWEKNEGLPVRRHVHRKLATVYVSTSELDEWWKNRCSTLAEAESAVPSEAPTDRALWRRLVWAAGFAAALAVITFAGQLFWRGDNVAVGPPGLHIQSLAVLPLANVSGDAEQDYFADGMTDALIGELTKISALRIVAYGSAMLYRERVKGTTKPVREIARELNVDAIVEGSVLLVADEVRITVRLVNAATDTYIWSDSYDRDLREVLALQGEVARAIAGEVKVTLKPEEEARLASAWSVEPDSHLAYLRGKAHWYKWTVEGVKESVEYFQQSIAADPRYAPAYAGLGMGLRFLTLLEDSPDKEQLFRARQAEQKALALDENLAEAHAGLASAFSFEWNWEEAEQHFRRSIDLKPGYALGHHRYAILYLVPHGRLDDALAEIHLALDLDPLSVPHHTMLGEILYYKRDYDQAIDQLIEALKLAPDSPQIHRYLGNAYREKGMYEEAVNAFGETRALTGSMRDVALLGHACAVSGKADEARRLLRGLLMRSEQKPVPPWAVALIYIGLGERSQALDWLERAYLDQEYWLSFLGVDPLYDSVRSEPRFAALVKNIGLGG